jgi:hypothetical protein
MSPGDHQALVEYPLEEFPEIRRLVPAAHAAGGALRETPGVATGQGHDCPPVLSQAPRP